MADLPPDRILGTRLIEIGHSRYSEPEFIAEGLGPAVFRSHFLRIDSGLVLDLFTAEIMLAEIDSFPMPGETEGIAVAELIGRTITDVWRDNVCSPLIVLDKNIYLRDANDGVYGNPLRAGVILDDYSPDERNEFTNYWTELPLN